jgi:hypothetical protein
MITLLSKLDVVIDPGSQMNDLQDIFDKRILLQTMLLKKERIQMTVPKLI